MNLDAELGESQNPRDWQQVRCWRHVSSESRNQQQRLFASGPSPMSDAGSYLFPDGLLLTSVLCVPQVPQTPIKMRKKMGQG